MLLLVVRWRDRQIRLRVPSRTTVAKVTQEAAELLGSPPELCGAMRLIADGCVLDPALTLKHCGVRDRAEVRLAAAPLES